MINSHVFPAGFQQFGISLICLAAAAAPLLLAAPLRVPGPGLSPAELRCEYRVNPLGIDVPQPRLSWILEADGREQKQTAYRVLVASSPAVLARDQGPVGQWPSGLRRDDSGSLQ